MDRVAEIVVFGTPAPQGSKRHVGRGVMVESSKKVKPWRQDVKFACLEWIRNQRQWVKSDAGCVFDGPLVCRIIFTVKKPTSAPKTRRTFPDRKPDIDKLLRSTLDAMTESGLIADDARIVELDRVAKVFPGEDLESLTVPGARILVWAKQ